MKCNGGASANDERFKIFLSLTVGGGHEESFKFWKEGGLRSIRSNQKLLNEIKSGPRILVDQNGSLKETIVFKWPAACHDETIERTTRGLFWHHFRFALEPEANVETYFLRGLDKEVAEILPFLSVHNIGGEDIFNYAFGVAPEDQRHSLWLFQFYNGHWAGASTSPPGFVDDEAELNITD